MLIMMNFVGNHKGGLSVGKSIASGWQAADLVITYLNSASTTVLDKWYTVDVGAGKVMLSIYQICLFDFLFQHL